MTVCFWNIRNKDLSDILIDLVEEQQVDILILAEASEQIIRFFLNKSEKIHIKLPFNQISDKKEKIKVLSRLDKSFFEKYLLPHKSNRWAIYKISIPNFPINIVTVHFHSKINWSANSLSLECVNLAEDINFIEAQHGIEDTILIGDFNMNPFEDGMIGANGLHAIQDLNFASKKNNGRNINGRSYKYFYNPMWNFFGDFEEPFGTHYCRPSGHISQEWNIYDQVVFRPSLSNYFKNDNVQIVDEIKGNKLTKNYNRPNTEKYSDHLPITFTLNYL